MSVAATVLAGLGLGSGLSLLRASWREARAARAAAPSGQFVQAGATRLHLEIRGDGPALVLIHGASGNLRDMTFRLAPALAKRFRTVSIDRPGLGHSPSLHRRGETLAEQADVIAAALRTLGHDRALVVGQSYGGSVALALALRHPGLVAGLVLIAAPSNPWEGGLGLLYALNAHPLSGPFLRLAAAAFAPGRVIDDTITSIFDPDPVPPGYAAHIGAELTLARRIQRANALQVANLKPQIIAMVPLYGRIACPVEMVHGTADTIVPLAVHSERLVRQISGARLTRIDGAGHMPHQIHTDICVAAVERTAARAGLT